MLLKSRKRCRRSRRRYWRRSSEYFCVDGQALIVGFRGRSLLSHLWSFVARLIEQHNDSCLAIIAGVTITVAITDDDTRITSVIVGAIVFYFLTFFLAYFCVKFCLNLTKLCSLLGSNTQLSFTNCSCSAYCCRHEKCNHRIQLWPQFALHGL